MKRVVFLMSLLVAVSSAMGASLSKQESKALTAFLNQQNAQGGVNAEALMMTGTNQLQPPASR